MSARADTVQATPEVTPKTSRVCSLFLSSRWSSISINVAQTMSVTPTPSKLRTYVRPCEWCGAGTATIKRKDRIVPAASTSANASGSSEAAGSPSPLLERMQLRRQRRSTGIKTMTRRAVMVTGTTMLNTPGKSSRLRKDCVALQAAAASMYESTFAPHVTSRALSKPVLRLHRTLPLPEARVKKARSVRKSISTRLYSTTISMRCALPSKSARK
mmetsp:Transcript_116343/g.324165  ORF Transcript_116343/g.324165 Transcript_116343/m.324165 type:complete len:215 (-) Transcript_116343:480-1124(-)